MASLNHRRHLGWFALAALVLTACGSGQASTAHQVAVHDTERPASTSAQVAASPRTSGSGAKAGASSVPPAKPATTARHTVPPTTAAPKLAVAPKQPTAAKPTVAPKPKAAAGLCGAPANPFGYTFCGGQVITAPDPAVCNYFSCIPNFPKGTGYMEQCLDGMYSMSGGRSGACSYHGGERQPVLKS